MVAEVIDITNFSTVQEGFQRLEHLVKLREKEKGTIFYKQWEKDCNRLCRQVNRVGCRERGYSGYDRLDKQHKGVLFRNDVELAEYNTF